MTLNLVYAPFFVVAVLLGHRWLNRRRRPPLPLGPKGLPIIGNLRDMNYDGRHSWMVYADWSKTYASDVLYLEVFGKPLIILNSAQAITDIMEKRSAVYSDRPDMHMVNDLMCFYWDTAHLKYSDWWRIHRKTFHQHFQPRAVIAYQPVQLKATSDLLRQLSETPDKFAAHVRRHAGGIILKVTYGYDIKPVDDEYVQLADEAIRRLSQAMNPGSFLVDFLPILKYVPAWFPGANSPFERLQASIEKGTASESFVTKNLSRIQNIPSADMPYPYPEMEEVVKNCAAIAYMAGADTTVSVVLTCILALVLNPEIQEKAQAQIDAAVGPFRLPTFEDRDQLSLITAIVSEAIRFLPTTPLALPHSSLSDDVYRGYFIPRGSTVIGNAWAVLHNPETYPEPWLFKPERFLGENVAPDPAVYAFGFRRRICPGRYLALNSAFIAIAGILSTFSIKKALDEDGNEIIPVVDCNEGTVTHPLPFRCSFVPRSSQASNLIHAGYDYST
ncbi:cytochrome P450 [Mycena floridula]|nr:cytochrome P450 [Mycena floridula]